MEEETKIKIYFAIFTIFIYFVGVGVGMYNGNPFDDREGKVLGFYAHNWEDESIKNYVVEKTPRYRGDWVCIDVDYLDYEQAVEVIVHEVAHHYYRQECYNSSEGCFSLEDEEFAQVCEAGYRHEYK
jgi:uncharacterized protein (DUF2164 family)